MIIPLCDRWHVLPSALVEEDPEVYRLVQLYDLANPKGGGQEEMPGA